MVSKEITVRPLADRGKNQRQLCREGIQLWVPFRFIYDNVVASTTKKGIAYAVLFSLILFLQITFNVIFSNLAWACLAILVYTAV